jgi:hypothetical protein
LGSNGADATFLIPGLGVTLSTTDAKAPKTQLTCSLHANLVVPAGYYVTSLTHQLQYGVLKPAGNEFSLKDKYRLHVHGGAAHATYAPTDAVDNPLIEADDVLDTSASMRHFCGRHHTHDGAVRYGESLDLTVSAPPNSQVIVDVDSVDLHADIAPCPTTAHGDAGDDDDDDDDDDQGDYHRYGCHGDRHDDDDDDDDDPGY